LLLLLLLLLTSIHEAATDKDSGQAM